MLQSAVALDSVFVYKALLRSELERGGSKGPPKMGIIVERCSRLDSRLLRGTLTDPVNRFGVNICGPLEEDPEPVRLICYAQKRVFRNPKANRFRPTGSGLILSARHHAPIPGAREVCVLKHIGVRLPAHPSGCRCISP